MLFMDVYINIMCTFQSDHIPNSVSTDIEFTEAANEISCGDRYYLYKF